MKKTIAALLVTILASAGYIVLDKAAVERIDQLESQVSVQQEVIDSFGAPVNTMDMQIGDTIPCYPAAGATVQAYVRDLSLGTVPIATSASIRPETTTTTRPLITYGQPTATTYRTEPTTAARENVIRAQSDTPTVIGPTSSSEPTAPHITEPCTGTTAPYWGTTAPLTTEPVPIETYPTVPTTWFSFDEAHHLRTDVSILSFQCKRTGTSLTGIPTFTISLSGKVDSSFSGREIEIAFGQAVDVHPYGETRIRSDGSFSVDAEAALASVSVIPLFSIVID